MATIDGKDNLVPAWRHPQPRRKIDKSMRRQPVLGGVLFKTKCDGTRDSDAKQRMSLVCGQSKSEMERKQIFIACVAIAPPAKTAAGDDDWRTT